MIPNPSRYTKRQRVHGTYCDRHFKWFILDCRHVGGNYSTTVEWKIELESPIMVYGQERTMVLILSNSVNNLDLSE